jgi:hypothetical protein
METNLLAALRDLAARRRALPSESPVRSTPRVELLYWIDAYASYGPGAVAPAYLFGGTPPRVARAEVIEGGSDTD